MNSRFIHFANTHRRAPSASMRARIGWPGGTGIDQAVLHVLK